MEKRCGLLVRSGLRLVPVLPREEFLITAEDGGVLAHLPPRHLPLTAPHASRNLELVRCTYLLAVVERLLHLHRQGDVVDVQNAIHAQFTEQEPREVLVAFLGVHDTVMARVAPVHECPRRIYILSVGTSVHA